MHGVVTLLPLPYYEMVETLWNELEERHGLRGIRVTPYPHFSWQIGETYDVPALKTALERLAAQTQPFTVHTTGLGIFTGERPVLFIPVVKSPELQRFHQQVWDALLPLTQGVSLYYSPKQWSPHISLAYEDLTPKNIGKAMKDMAFRSFNWEFLVDNLSFIYEPAGSIGSLQVTIPFAKP